MNSSFAPGQRVESRCTRCRDLTGHVIVALVDGEIAKVECCACKSVHKYYPPVAPRKEAKTGPLRVRSGAERGNAVLAEARKAPREPKVKPPTATQVRTARAREELERHWQDAVARYPGTPKPYAMTATFEQGEVMDHPVFGLGVVTSAESPGKVEVLFREGAKSLRCAS